MSRYQQFDRTQLNLGHLSERGHDLTAESCLPLVAPDKPFDCEDLRAVGDAIRVARSNNRPVVVMIGGHPIKLGLCRYLIDLMEKRWITHLATNGAGIIHDFELAMAGGTSEDVAKWIKVGQFGLWKETSLLNTVIKEAADRNEGLGEGVGRHMEETRFPQRNLSLANAGWRTGVPVTSHVTIGGDIIHSMPNCDGTALGKVSYTDFLIFAQSIASLEGGVFLNIGSAVTGPEVYLKALSMARNVAKQRGEEVRDFTTAVFDLVDLPRNWQEGPPSKDHAGYYYRPWKTILIRTVADGGKSHYVRGDHRQTIPSLWYLLAQCTANAGSQEDHIRKPPLEVGVNSYDS